MSITWIRHGEKNYSNGHAPIGYHNHDPPIKENVKEKISNLCENLKEKHGLPEKIICSPFLRTRETAYLIREYLIENEKIYPGIYIDNDISEFLGWGNPKGDFADISSQTEFFIKPILGTEKLKDVKKRSINHIKNVDRNKNILIITHGIIIGFLYKYLTGNNLHRVGELRGINTTEDITKKFIF